MKQCTAVFDDSSGTKSDLTLPNLIWHLVSPTVFGIHSSIARGLLWLHFVGSVRYEPSLRKRLKEFTSHTSVFDLDLQNWPMS